MRESETTVKCGAYSIERRRSVATGFSLAELLIAIGIMGAGLAMAAALFPAGMVASEDSFRDITGTIICQNGLAITKARLRYDPTGQQVQGPNSAMGTGGMIGTFVDGTALLLEDETHYPMGLWEPDKSRRGFLLLVRKSSSGIANHMFGMLALSYQLSPANGTPIHYTVTAESVPGNDSQLGFSSGTDMDYVTPGSPVIVASTGAYASVVDCDRDNKKATVDRPFPEAHGQSVFVVCEDVGGGSLAPTSPGMTVLTAEMELASP